MAVTGDWGLGQGGGRDLRNGGPAQQALPAERATAHEAGENLEIGKSEVY